MEKKQPGVILMVVGGALMVVGSFLTWLTAKIDLVAFADAIKKETGVDIGGMPGFSSTPNSSSIAGIKGWEGKLALIGGVLALALGIAAIVGKVTGSRASRFAFIGGALGIFGGLYVMLTKSSGIADAKAGAAATFTAAGVSPSVLDNIFTVSVGVGLYLALIGGILAIVGGIMSMGKGATTATMPAATTGAAADAPAAGAGWEPPAAPPIAPPAAPPSMPATPPTQEPPAPMGDAGGTPES